MAGMLPQGMRGFRRQALFIAALLLPAATEPPPREPLPRPPLPANADDPGFAVLAVRGADTLVLRDGAEERTVRLAGIHVPRVGGAEDESVRFLTRLLMGESVWLEVQEEPAVYLYRVPDGLLVNLELVRQGYARVAGAGELTQRPVLEAYERLARREGKGIWARPVEAALPASSQPAHTEEAAAPRGDDGVLVYVTPHGKKYHRRDCQHVRNGATALTLREARAKGYTPCSRCKPPE